MELTRKQEEGLRLCVARYKARDPYTCIAGYAGSGKSTMVQFIVAALGLNPAEDVCYIAYTGKAALVLQSKGCPNAQTAHKLLYQSYKREDGTYYHKPKKSIEGNYKLIIVDEVSMIPKNMWELLLSHGIPVIACGDPEQLPAIGEPTDVLQHPHVFLDEIMRQAQESEIIRLSMDVREGKPLTYMKGKDIRIISPFDVVDGIFNWADQVLCATNNTRRSLNSQMRKQFFDIDDETPIIGDKMICLHNNWDKVNGNGDALVNGTIGTIQKIGIKYVPKLGKVYGINLDCGDSQEPSPMHTFYDLNIDYKYIHEGQESINKTNFKLVPKPFRPNVCDYGYAITTWKAQGSEWPKVLLFEEPSWPRSAEDRRKFLYTAITRAQEKLVIVKGWG